VQYLLVSLLPASTEEETTTKKKEKKRNDEEGKSLVNTKCCGQQVKIDHGCQ
jgi:hypothetical protein